MLVVWCVGWWAGRDEGLMAPSVFRHFLHMTVVGAVDKTDNNRRADMAPKECLSIVPPHNTRTVPGVRLPG